VGAGDPEDAVAAHALPAGEDVLHRPAVGVSDVEPSGDVWRRDDHDVARRALGPGRLETAVLLPAGVPACFEVGRMEVLRRASGGRLRGFDDFGHEKRALGALSYIRRRRAFYSRRPSTPVFCSLAAGFLFEAGP